ncbi:MAG: ABC transporter substrate-binding protein [Treponema sp.]|nr:ABC transporter substrate-binding protein [Treponema sp.]
MKKFVCTILVLALAVPLVFAGGAKQAKRKIVIYTSMYEDVIDAVKNDLSRQFPAYNIEFVYGGTGTLQARVAAEKSSGRLGCDILLVAEPSYSLELKESGMLHSYKSAHASSLAFDYDSGGFWYPVRVSNMVLAYNPERNAINTVPNSFRDFAYSTGVRGAVSMSNPLISGTAMATVSALRDKYGFEYFEALGRQNVMIDTGYIALAKLESGECKAAMILEELVLKKREEEQSRLEVIYPSDGTVMIPSTIMIINNRWSANRNTQAAEAIADWFLSVEGQNAIVSGWMHSVRTDFPRLPFDAMPTDEIRANSIPVNWEYCFRQGDEIQASFEEHVTHRR